MLFPTESELVELWKYVCTLDWSTFNFVADDATFAEETTLPNGLKICREYMQDMLARYGKL